VFDRQDQAYRQAVLPPGVPARVAVEAAVSQGWAKYVGLAGAVVCCERFGTSAPADQAMIECGLTTEAVVAAARQVLLRAGG
jgi:transketolase